MYPVGTGEERMIEPSEQSILRVAQKHLETHNVVTVRDVYYLLTPRSWRGYRGSKAAHRGITLQLIARTLARNGYVVVEKRSKGYSKYAKRSDDNDGN